MPEKSDKKDTFEKSRLKDILNYFVMLAVPVCIYWIIFEILIPYFTD